MIPFISKRFPESHIMSAHRSGLGTAKSSYQVFYDMALNMVLPTIWNRLVSYILFWGEVSRIIFLMSSGMGEEFERHLMIGQYRDSFYLHYVRWITNSLLYLKYYGDANPGKLTCVNFEDLMSDKQGTLSQVSSYCPTIGSDLIHVSTIIKSLAWFLHASLHCSLVRLSLVQGHKLSSQALISRRSRGRNHWTALILGPGTIVYGLELAAAHKSQ